MVANENDKGIYFIPFGYAVCVFGLLAYTMGTFGPALGVNPERGLQLAVVLAGAIFLALYHRIARSIMERWDAHNEFVIARMQYEADQLGAPAIDYGGAGPADATEDDDTGRIQVNTTTGSYSIARLNEFERVEMAEIGDCLKFIAIGIRSKGFSLRAMQINRPTGWSETKFEKWWTARGDKLAGWGLFEKSDRSATRPAGGRTPEDVRRALLRREFPRSAATVGQTGQRQTA